MIDLANAPSHVYVLDELDNFCLRRVAVSCWLDPGLIEVEGCLYALDEDRHDGPFSLTLADAYRTALRVLEVRLGSLEEAKQKLLSIRLAVQHERLDLVEVT